MGSVRQRSLVLHGSKMRAILGLLFSVAAAMAEKFTNPVLDWSSKYSLENGQRAYVKGIWASSLRYRESDGKFYFVACIEFGKTYVYSASSPTGPWSQIITINKCYYDAG